MLTVAFVCFIGSLTGLAVLFILKYIELRRGIVYAPHFRMRADEHAHAAKELFFAGLARVERLPRDMVVLLQLFVHIAALLMARAARAAEIAAHRIADRVSHKHQFERNESRSEFLKTISQHKNTLVSTPLPMAEPLITGPAPVAEPVVKAKTAGRKRVAKPRNSGELTEIE